MMMMNRRRQTSMLCAGFVPTASASKLSRPTPHTAATGTDSGNVSEDGDQVRLRNILRLFPLSQAMRNVEGSSGIIALFLLIVLRIQKSKHSSIFMIHRRPELILFSRRHWTIFTIF
jgi:hypothetical protein